MDKSEEIPETGHAPGTIDVWQFMKPRAPVFTLPKVQLTYEERKALFDAAAEQLKDYDFDLVERMREFERQQAAEELADRQRLNAVPPE